MPEDRDRKVTVATPEREIGREVEGAGPRPAPQESAQPSVGELFGRLAADTGELVRREVALAKLELREAARTAGRDAAAAAVGAALALGGWLALVACAAIALGNAFGGRYWASTLLLGALLLAAGARVARVAVRSLGRGLAPEETIRTLGEDARFFKDEARDVRREFRA